ncbi:YdcF family protein [Epibacterium ulvae]|uniref:YdcF family protein n=1 Tax=Epibacterium ulvae TaxID=1156985 RepID=UPI001BFC1494|nr:YdcF family protein [Epibacterium ulvae]MBT8155739.1 YdcF family protein [Epibacterium ulvae]
MKGANVSDHIVREAAKRLWAFHCKSDPLERADAIVGLGSYDLRVAEKCASLYAEGWAPEVLFSGATGNWTGSLFGASEADVFAKHAAECGLPPAVMCLEPNARNIGENMQFSARMLPSARHVILVTKPQTQQRCRATAAVQWPGATASVTSPATSFEDQPLPHHDMRALVCEMVGDLERIRTYPALGFQKHVNIPADVMDAFKTLRAAGLTDHMP